jgi:outer membrane protein
MRLSTRSLLTAWALLAAIGPRCLPAGQEEKVLRLTLAETVERSLAASAQLTAFEQLGLRAAADVRAARAERLPSAWLSAGYTRRSNVPELSIGSPPRTIFPNIPNSYAARLGLSLPLYTGGRLTAAVEAARESERAAERELDAVTRDLVLETHAAYWSFVTARETERVVDEGLVAFEAHLKDARNRESFGLAARNDVLAVQVERDRSELRRLRARNGAALAEANLQRLLGLGPETSIETLDTLATEAAAEEELEALVSAGLASRPERARIEAQIRALEALVRIERAARWPQVGVSAGLDYANPNRQVLPPEAAWKHTWDVGVQLSVSVFDGGRVSAAVARAEAEGQAARHRLADLERRIRLQVTQAALGLETAQAAVDVAERGFEAARENHRVAGERYREGVIPSSALLDASVAQLQAGLDRTQALAEVRLAAADLDRAVGR